MPGKHYCALQLPVPGNLSTEALLHTRAHAVWYPHVQTGLVPQFFEQTDQIIGMLFFHGENAFEHAPSSGVVIAEIGNYLAIAINGNPFCHQIFLDHINKRVAFDILCMAAAEESIGRKVRGAAELHNTLGNLVSVQLFLSSMLEKLG